MKAIKHIIRTALIAAGAMLWAIGCDRPFEMDLPLAVNSHKVSLSAEAGSTHIMVWADGPWTASFGKTIGWGSLNKLSGEGNNDIVFKYAKNFGVARSVDLILTKGSLKDTIKLVQAGTTTGDNASLNFKTSALTLLRNGYSVNSPVSTSMIYGTDMIVPSVEFFDAYNESLGVVTAGEEIPDTLHITPWISNMEVIQGKNPSDVSVKYDVDENNTGEARFAVLTIKVDAADGTVYDSRQTITQGLEEAALTLESDSGQYSGFSSNYTIDTPTNNVFPYTQFISCQSGADWISDVSLDKNGLNFTVSTNDTGSPRNADVTATFNDGNGTMLSVSYTVTQLSYPSAISFQEVRSMPAGTLSADKFIEGYIVSDPASANVCQNLQTAQFKFDFDENDKTAYIESTDGKYGFCLKFNTREDNVTKRWQRVRIGINGLTLERQADPLCFTLRGLTAGNIIETIGEPDEFNVPAKKRSIAELTDDDIFTMVSLQDIEIMCKDGCYTNATDGYSYKDPGVNPTAGTTSPRWDTAPLLMSDKSGNVIYMLTNARVNWRRNGSVYGNGTEIVAQGSGTYRGIITAEELVRYGELGRYKIRPLDKTDIQLENPAFSKTIVEWNWNNKVTDTTPEIGSGTLNVYGATTAAASDFNSMQPYDGSQKGLVPNAALKLTKKWWNFAEDKGEYIDVSFSTSGLSGSNLIFGIVWNHGAMGNTTLDSPAHWNLLYSIDGGEFKPVPGDMIKNRSIVWWTTTSQDSCPGFKDHLRKLPDECFGKDKVVLRLQVADKVTDIKPGTAAATYLENLGIEKGTLTDKATEIRIGTITVRYN